MHDRARVRPVGLGPVDGQQPADPELKADLLGDLPGAAGVRRLAVLADPARERPVVAVVRLDQQNPVRRVGDQRPGRHHDARQLREPGVVIDEGGPRDGRIGRHHQSSAAARAR